MMSPKNKMKFPKGHYRNSNYEFSLSQVKNEQYNQIQCENEDAADYLYEDASIFLMGSCQLFALALHEEFGYDAYEIQDDQNRLIHVFCKGKYQGEDVYIDVRGVTNDWTEFSSYFRFRMGENYTIVPHDLEEDKKLEEEGALTGYSFAQAIAKKDRVYYDLT